MLIDHTNEKLVNAIAYFVKNTRFCGKTKLYKLLYFLDFDHYSETGRSVTGLDYFAWPKGPVPVSIHNQIDETDSELNQSFDITNRTAANGYKMVEFSPKFKCDTKYFSKRERRLLQQLATEFSDSYAVNMIEATHLENLPWHRTYNQSNGRQELIPYELALKPSEADSMAQLISENDDFGENYR